MSISKTFQPGIIEQKWYTYWMENGLFRSTADYDTQGARKEPFTVVLPPPNVTGVLHMGHMLNITIQDILVRRARMLGKNACWVPGTDHASIATEAKLVTMLRDEGLTKEEIGRTQFLVRAFEWKEKYGKIILEQLQKLGASCDWDRTRFTMEPSLTLAVEKVFITLYDKDLIYRGIRMVNWDPLGRTALSDEEVLHKAVKLRLYYITYKFCDGSGGLVIATARPETIMADAAIAVNPHDTRYKHLVGKTVYIPLIDREISIIEDDYVSSDFGTGCLKVTPAHSLQDYEIGLRHNLAFADILAEDGTLNSNAQIFVGEDRFTARAKIVDELNAKGYLVRSEEYETQIGYSERTGAIIEPRLSMQWFLKMETLAKPALNVVLDGTVKLFPARFTNTYRHWMENAHDWCISRQLWWGQQIPAWYNEAGEIAVALDESSARLNFQSRGLSSLVLKQDEDVLDTWFSSWLWPISVFDGITNPGNPDISYFYPGDDLVTAPEILFFWVSRMIIAGQEFMQKVPFKNVYLTGIVRDKQGRKMSKSLGNSPDPLELIARLGADAVRTGLLLSSPAGNDLLFDESLIDQGRNFGNKIWNAFRLVSGWEQGLAGDQGTEKPKPEYSEIAMDHFSVCLNTVLESLPQLFNQYRLSEALMAIYKLVYDDFCSWFLEIVKPEFGQVSDHSTVSFTKNCFEVILRLLHPFMPFLTEELWQELKDEKQAKSIMLSTWPLPQELSQTALSRHSFIEKEVRPLVQQIRSHRNTQSILLRVPLEITVSGRESLFSTSEKAVIRKAANLSEMIFSYQQPSGTVSLLVEGKEYWLPAGKGVDPSAEILKLEGELVYTLGFLDTVNQKLNNSKFIANAKPDVIETERKKKISADEKIKQLEGVLSALKS